ncbi:MAG: HEAT repeat domain-containing protein [bacterium]
MVGIPESADILMEQDKREYSLILRFFNEVEGMRDLNTIGEMRLHKVFDVYWDKMHRIYGEEFEALLFSITEKMRKRKALNLPPEEIERTEDDVYGKILEESVILKEFYDGESGEWRTGFTHEEFMEYAMGRELFTRLNWSGKGTLRIRQDVDRILKEAKSYQVLIGVLGYMILGLRDSRSQFCALKRLMKGGYRCHQLLCKVIVRMDEITERIFDLLKSISESPNLWSRKDVAYALGKLGEYDRKKVRNLLLKLSQDGERWVRKAALESLAEMDQDESNRMLSTLRNLVTDESSAVRESVARSLLEVGKVNPDGALEVLSELAKDKDEAVRTSVFRTLEGIGTARLDKAFEILQNGLEGESELNEIAVECLYTLAKPRLNDLVREGKRSEIDRMVDFMLLHPRSTDALADITAGSGWAVRRSVIKSLEHVNGSLRDAAFKILDVLASDEDNYIRSYAREAIETMRKE